jgi:hypothetical protein
MLLDCTNCGAPLDVQPGAWMATCGYCKRTQTVRQKTKHAIPTPPGWNAPPQWTPPTWTAGRVQVMPFDPTAAARKQARVIGCVVLFPILLTLLGVAIPIFITLGGTGLFTSFSWDGKDTLDCGGSDRTTLKDVDVKAKASPAILVHGNCRLTIEGSKISGKNLIEVRDSGQLTVKDSVLTVKGRRGLFTDGNFGARIQSSKIRIEAEGDQAVTVQEAHTASSVELDDTTIEVVGGGAVSLFLASGLGHFRMTGGSVDAGKRDLVVDGPNEIEGVELNGSKVVRPGETPATVPTVPSETLPADPTCAAAYKCCLKTLGAQQCEPAKQMPASHCGDLLKSYRQAAAAMKARCD